MKTPSEILKEAKRQALNHLNYVREQDIEKLWWDLYGSEWIARVETQGATGRAMKGGTKFRISEQNHIEAFEWVHRLTPEQTCERLHEFNKAALSGFAVEDI